MPDTAGLRGTETFQPPLPSLRGLISVEEYLKTSYSPDREYRDGLVLERNVGDKEHSRLQARLAHYLGQRRKQWNIEVYTELKVQVEAKWFPLPDVCVYMLPDFEGHYPSKPPDLWVEILSPSDIAQDVVEKTRRLLAGGVPHVWIINPATLTNEFHSAAGIQQSADILVVPGTPIEIKLSDVMAE
jgi:Uma2 family endonuclease